MNSNFKDRKCVLDIETTGFNPWDGGRIVTIGAMDVNSEEIKVFYTDREEDLLINFLQYFNSHDFKNIVGYNINYDVRYILARCLKHRVPAQKLHAARRIDMMMIFKNFRKGYSYNKAGTLNQWSKAILGRGKLPKDGSVKELYKQGRIDEILAYNKRDVEITYELWKRLNFVLEV